MTYVSPAGVIYTKYQTFKKMNCRVARYVENALLDDRAFLVLYCQQFAFASEMVKACEEILTCRATHKHYNYYVWFEN